MKNVKLLTSAIVSGLHPNQAHSAGTVYAAKDEAAEQEAKALIRVGYAEETDEKVNYVDKSLPKSEQISGIKENNDAPLKEILTGTVDEVVAQFPQLSPDDFKRLVKLESQGKGRSTLLDRSDEYIDSLDDAAAAAYR